MDYYSTLVFGSIFALIFLYTALQKLSIKKLPPGPSPWPIIGNIHLLGAKPHVSLTNLAKIYGPIMSLKLGQIATIVISSSSMAKQVLKNQDQAFSSRFIPNAIQHNYYKFSVACLPICPQWRTLRKILNTNILSPNNLDANQHLRSQKVKELITYCEKCSQQGQPLDIGHVTFKTNLNLLSNTLFSQDLADLFSDSKVELKEVIWDILTEVGKPNLVDFFPILEKIGLQGIRRRTSVHIVNVWVIGRDFTFWDDPLVFKPERFWSSDLDMRGQDFELIPFGVGRRICPGFPLALRMVPVILGSLLTSFNWKLEADIEPKDLDMEKFGITLAKAHPLRAIPFPL
ncbi:hypothetical protein R3W88_032106 [Solanum pinnatisectum]|uniref:Cytochrome P450 n=1 Tax=Solanum pinnatisectum TaxID=50273 RepID=A0AAV9LRN1_9SOLN|nr:hypothetical protein R3W88_032106 [Solanum pinnatisectum]